MEVIMKVVLLFSLIAFALTTHAEDSFFIGDPLSLKQEAYSVVSSKFPDAELWLIQNYSREQWAQGCSQFGWIYLFIGSENGLEKDVRIKFDHARQADGTCKYTARKEFEVEPSQVVGIQRLELAKVHTEYQEAQATAEKTLNVPFKIWWAKLITPLHPAANGRVFWNFKGPVECNKGAEISIDASTGQFEKAFSTLPSCP